MSFYYFDTSDGFNSYRDEIGIDLPDLGAARAQAIRALPEVARDVLPNAADRLEIRVEVRDEAKQLVFAAQLTFTARWIE